MIKATDDLRKEHKAILYVLDLLENMISTDSKEDALKHKYYNEVIYFLKVFADQCHHGKEENYLFQELTNFGFPVEGGPVGVMLQEHDQGRKYILKMNQALEAHDLRQFEAVAQEYSVLLRNHIDKENNVLFPMADQLFDSAKQEELFDLFEKHEEKEIGHGIHEKLHAMIDKWADEFGRQG